MHDLKPAWPNWWNADDYRLLAGLSGPAAAWEFLRRNPSYRAEAPAGVMPPGERHRHIAVTASDARFFERWGLQFCRSTGARDG